MEKLTIQGEAMNASLEGILIAEQFLHDNYQFRRNVLNGKVEFLRIAGNKQEELECATKTGEGLEPQFRPLTQQALNSIILHAKHEDICEGKNPKQDIQEYINSEEIPTFDPIKAYLDNLPQWDGQNHVAQLFSRIPGISSEQLAFLSI